MKTFTLDEAQSLLPVMESLLKRAIEGKQSAEQVESGLSEIAGASISPAACALTWAGGQAARGDGGAPAAGAREHRRNRLHRRAGEGPRNRTARFPLPHRRSGRAALLAHGRDRPSSTGTRSKPASKTASPSTSASAAAPLPAAGPTEARAAAVHRSVHRTCTSPSKKFAPSSPMKR